MFNLWTKIDGNSVEKLDKFYNVLFATFDEVPTGTRYYTVHEYLTKKVHRQDPIILDPLRFFADVDTFAARIAWPTRGASGVVAVVGGPGRKTKSGNTNNCDHCNSNVCFSKARGGGLKDCLCFNPGLKVPDSASSGEKRFLTTCRVYIKETTPRPKTLKKLSFKDVIVPAAKAAAEKMKHGSKGDAKPGESPPTAAPVVAPVGGGVAPPTDGAPSIKNIEQFKEYINQRATQRQVSVLSAPLDCPIPETTELDLSTSDAYDDGPVLESNDSTEVGDFYAHGLSAIQCRITPDELSSLIALHVELAHAGSTSAAVVCVAATTSPSEQSPEVLSTSVSEVEWQPSSTELDACLWDLDTIIEDVDVQDDLDVDGAAGRSITYVANPVPPAPPNIGHVAAPVFDTPVTAPRNASVSDPASRWTAGTPPIQPVPSVYPANSPLAALYSTDSQSVAATVGALEPRYGSFNRGGVAQRPESMHLNRGGANEQVVVDQQAQSTKQDGNARAKVTASEYIARGLAAHEATLREMTAKIERLSDRTMSAATKAAFRSILQTIGSILRRVVASANEYSWSQLGCIAAFLYNVLPRLLPHARNRLLVALARAIRSVPFVNALIRALHEMFVLIRGLGRTALASLVVILGHTGVNFERLGHVLAKVAQLFSFFVHRSPVAASSTASSPSAAGPAAAASLMEQVMDQVERSFLGQGNVVAMMGDVSMAGVASRTYELGALLHENFISKELSQLHAQWASIRRQPAPYVVCMDPSTIDSPFYGICNKGQLGKAPWLRHSFADPCNIMFNVVQGDDWLAGLLVRPCVGVPDTTYIIASYTHPRMRRQGMQRMLVGMVERELRPSRLVRQANNTEADDRVQLNIKLGFGVHDWAAAFVRSEAACNIMPSLLKEHGGDCVAMGKMAQQPTPHHMDAASAIDLASSDMPTPGAAVVADQRITCDIAPWVSSRSRRDGVFEMNYTPNGIAHGRLVVGRQHLVASDSHTAEVVSESGIAELAYGEIEMAGVEQLNANLWDKLGYSPTPSQLRTYVSSSDVAKYDAMVLVLDALENASVQLHTAVTVDPEFRDCITWINPRIRGLRQYIDALLNRRLQILENTVELARDAFSSETLARFARIGYPPIPASSMHSFLVVSAAVNEAYPTREQFIHFDCGGTRSHCERHCGCISAALSNACDQHEATIANFLADRRGSHAYVAAYNDFLRPGGAFQEHLLQPATPALLSHHNGMSSSACTTPVVMPIDATLPSSNIMGRVGKHVVAIASQMPNNVALGDDGATVDCCCSDIGRVPNTFDGSQRGKLAIGDSESTLLCEGTWLHALTRVGADGTEDDGVFEMNYTPNGIAHIFSECLEVNRRGTTITWSPNSSRCYQLASGKSLPLQMSSNGLGWIIIKPIENQQRQHDAMVASSKHNPRLVAVLIAQLSPISSMAPTRPVPLDLFADAAVDAVDSDNDALAILARAAEFGVAGLPQSTVVAVLAARVNASVAQVVTDDGNPCSTDTVLIASHNDGLLYGLDHDFLCQMDCPDMLRVILNVHAGVSMSGAPKLTQYELLRRTHSLLAHAPIDVCVTTIEHAFAIKVSAAVVERFKREGCGICDSMKMRRRTFRHNLTDHTPVPIGKKWEFDSIKLRVPSALGGFWYITRFINIIENGRGKKRSYGHKLLDSESIEHCIQKLRAFVRPVHGEIWIYRRDGLPAQQSHRIEDYWTDCDPSPFDETSPPYVHEGVGATENSWQWDVPAANCLLRASNSSEPHFYTAFLDVERSSNALVPPGGKSRDEVYYGCKQQPLLTMGLIYGSPVKFLTHPEIRDSKFSEHAQPGILRGGSRDDESLHRALVQVGTGVTMRHTLLISDACASMNVV